MTHYLLYNVALLVSSIPALLVVTFSHMLLLVVIMPPLVGMCHRMDNQAPILDNLMLMFAAILCFGFLLGYFYIWSMWPAYCAAITLRYTSEANAGLSTVYFFSGLLHAGALIVWLRYHQHRSASASGHYAVLLGSNWWGAAGVVMYVIFIFAPTAARYLYGWAFKPLNLID